METRIVNNENFEKRTEIPKEPRIGAGHPNLDPALLDPKPPQPEPPKPVQPNKEDKK
jgi:hypothetical protein